MIKYFKFLIDLPGFWYNQIYEPFYVFNENEHQVYNKIHINK